MEQFNYVIARKWFNDSDQLNCYTYHNTVFFGTLEDAIEQRDFIRGRAEEHADEFDIYKIDSEPIKLD